jgi:hypothetical protein
VIIAFRKQTFSFCDCCAGGLYSSEEHSNIFLELAEEDARCCTRRTQVWMLLAGGGHFPEVSPLKHPFRKCERVRELKSRAGVASNVHKEDPIGREREDHLFGSVTVGQPSSVTNKQTWGSSSPPSARSSGTIRITSPLPDCAPGSRGGVVTETSSYI